MKKALYATLKFYDEFVLFWWSRPLKRILEISLQLYFFLDGITFLKFQQTVQLPYRKGFPSLNTRHYLPVGSYCATTSYKHRHFHALRHSGTDQVCRFARLNVHCSSRNRLLSGLHQTSTSSVRTVPIYDLIKLALPGWLNNVPLFGSVSWLAGRIFVY